MNYTIISFYADLESSTYYSEHAKRLKSRCAELGLTNHIVRLDGTNNYYQNTRIKPSFILDCLLNFKKPVLWIDVDSELRVSPSPYILDDCDIMFERHPNIKPLYPMVAHALYFNYSPASILFLEEWKEACNKATDKKIGDHSIFASMIKQCDLKYSFFKKRFLKMTLAPKHGGKQ